MRNTLTQHTAIARQLVALTAKLDPYRLADWQADGCSIDDVIEATAADLAAGNTAPYLDYLDELDDASADDLARAIQRLQAA